MEFSSQEVADLRRKLGWSQAELGRRLGVSLDHVMSWEQAQAPIPSDIVDQLVYLRHQTDTLSETIVFQAAAQAVLQKTSRTQVHRDEIDLPSNQDDIA